MFGDNRIFIGEIIGGRKIFGVSGGFIQEILLIESWVGLLRFMLLFAFSTVV